MTYFRVESFTSVESVAVLSNDTLFVVSGILPFTFSIGTEGEVDSVVVVVVSPFEQEKKKPVNRHTAIFFMT